MRKLNFETFVLGSFWSQVVEVVSDLVEVVSDPVDCPVSINSNRQLSPLCTVRARPKTSLLFNLWKWGRWAITAIIAHPHLY